MTDSPPEAQRVPDPETPETPAEMPYPKRIDLAEIPPGVRTIRSLRDRHRIIE